jgi:mRNA interferase RelE/StbE
MYEIKFSPVAEKYFKKIKEKPLKKAYNIALNEISENPYIGEQKKGDLTEIYGYDVKYNI